MKVGSLESEYCIGKHIWPLYLIRGILCVGFSLFIVDKMVSILIAVLGFTMF
ncbi:MAG: hypothetical protein K0R54_1878 [Clostridiaceae bacterium]|jgi:hypothetical protein|nr:hypothetical protein [Clostridiaceae bacterium]